MSVLKITTILLLISSLSFAQTYEIDWYVIGSGGGSASSSNYAINGTIGQPVVGGTSSESYTVEAGYWVGAEETQASAYPYFPGDANMHVGVWGATGPSRLSSDVTYLVNYFKTPPAYNPCYMYNANYTGSAPVPGYFWASADFNGNCAVQSSDVVRLVSLFRGQIPAEDILKYCGWDKPDPENYFVPLWPNAGDPGDPTPQAGWTSEPNALCEDLPVPLGVKVIPQSKSE